MSQADLEIQPVPVKITNAHELMAGRGADNKHRKHTRATFRTFVLTAANPVVAILAEDRSRFDTWLIAYGNSVVICESQSQAEDPANFIAGTGVFSQCPLNPQGTLLYVPTLNVPWTTQPVPQSVRWTLDTTEVAYACAMVFPAVLAMTTHNHVEGY
jgi:hypothetical protein